MGTSVPQLALVQGPAGSLRTVVLGSRGLWQVGLAGQGGGPSQVTGGVARPGSCLSEEAPSPPQDNQGAAQGLRTRGPVQEACSLPLSS